MPMKWNLALLSVMLLSLVNVSCSKKSGDEGGVTPSMYDGWMLTSWNGDESIAGRVYLSFSDDRFTLYQQIGDLSTSGFTKYTGTCTFAGNGKLLTGVYSDGTPLADRIRRRDPYRYGTPAAVGAGEYRVGFQGGPDSRPRKDRTARRLFAERGIRRAVPVTLFEGPPAHSQDPGFRGA